MARKPKAVEQPAQPTSDIPQDLTDKVKALKQLINVHDLLSTASYEGFKAKRVDQAIDFIVSLHKQVLEDAQAHPQANLIPELLQKGE